MKDLLYEYRPGTGIGNRSNAKHEAIDLQRILDAYEERRKKSPCGTHTLGKEFGNAVAD